MHLKGKQLQKKHKDLAEFKRTRDEKLAQAKLAKETLAKLEKETRAAENKTIKAARQ